MNEYRLIFDYMHLNGLSLERLWQIGMKMKPVKLFEICQKLLGYINIDEPKELTEFNIMANSTMSGESIHFNDHDQRVQRVSSLLSSTLLFADTIWIKNPLDEYANVEEDFFNSDEGKNVFLFDLFILYLYKSSLEAGLVKICKTKTHFCRHCLIESLDKVPSKYEKQLSLIDKKLSQEFIKGADYKYERVGEKYEVTIKPKKEGVFPEQEYCLEYEEPIKEYEKALTRKNCKIHQKELKGTYLIECDFVNPILNDIIMHDYYSSDCHLNYFTDRNVDMDLIKMLNGRDVNQMGNKLINSLEHNFPFVGNVPFDKLIELRENEPEAFKTYRDSVETIIRNSSNLSEKELIEAIKDEVRPNINKIDSTIKKHSNKLTKGTLGNLIYCLGSVIIGLKGGFLPSQASSALAALGIANHGGQTVQNIIKLLNVESEVSDEKYYFLWKLKENN